MQLIDVYGFEDLVDRGTFLRGAVYAVQQKSTVDLHDASTGMLSGTTIGSGAEIYAQTVRYQLGSDTRLARFQGQCSCPMGDDCKHTVALFLTAVGGVPMSRAAPPPRAVAAHTPRPIAPPAWERSLSTLVTAETTRPDTESLALLLSPTAASGGRPGSINVRPLRRGKSGKWVRTGASWSDLEYSYRSVYPPRQLAALLDLARLHAAASGLSGWGRHGDGLGLSEIDTPALWDVVHEIVASGVTLLAGDQALRPVAMSSALVEGFFDLSRSARGIRVVPVLAVEHAPLSADRTILVGNPAHGVAVLAAPDADGAAAIILHRGASRLDPHFAAAYRAGPIVVPAADEKRFRADFLPVLVQRHSVRTVDGSFPIPEVELPVLALHVRTFAEHGLELTWAWRYRIGVHDRRCPVAPDAADPFRRQPAAEADVIAGLRLVLSALQDKGTATDWLWDQTTGLPADRSISHAARTIDVAAGILPALAGHPGIDVHIADPLPDYRESTELPVIAIGAQGEQSRDWFELQIKIMLAGAEVPFENVFRALALNQEILILPDGQYFSLQRPEFARLAALIEEARSLTDRVGGLGVSRYQMSWWEELEQLGVVDAQAARWAAQARAWQAVDTAPVPVPVTVAANLRPYQEQGYQWLRLLRAHGLGGILADDMGLGKTLQALTMMTQAKDDPDNPTRDLPWLVVAPTSVLPNWHSEAARFSPDLQVVSISETEVRRGRALVEAVAGADLVLTSYTLFRLESDAYERIPFAGMLLDEAQFVKNYRGKAFQCVKKHPAPVKIALSGTPLENNLMELWALFSLVAPGLFPSPQRFAEYYRTPIERTGHPERLQQLRRRIAPLMLRRTKEQVAPELPDKQEQILELALEPAHAAVYQRQLQRERGKILGLLGDFQSNRIAILGSLMTLRQAAIDPFLIDEKHATVGSTKLNALTELLDDIISEDHRVLVFSQFTRFLSRVRDRLEEQKIAHAYLDGRTRNRAQVIDRFKSGSAPVFLISLKAGGVGLNLTEADYCILLDPWWNPATEAQAVDRTHRIGQSKPVMVYRLVAKDTIEEKVMALKDSKAALVASVLSADGGGAATITAEDIRALLS